MFLGFKEEVTFVKMQKPRKKKSLASSWEALFLFVKYMDRNGFLEQDQGGKFCVIKGKEEQLWDRPKRDLQLFHIAFAL
jgi:hypothetical protein